MPLANAWRGFSISLYLNCFPHKKTNTLKIIMLSIPPYISWHDPVSYLSITPSASVFLCLTLQDMPYPLWEAKTAGRAGCPAKLCSRRGFKERHNLFKEAVDVRGRQEEPLIGENLPYPSKVLGLCMRIKLFSETRFCSEYCLTNMLNIVEKHRMMIFSMEVLKITFSSTQKQGHAGRWARTPVSKSIHRPLWICGSILEKTKVEYKTSFIFHNLLYTNCAKSELANDSCIRNILTRMKEWEGIQHSINVTLSLTSMLCSAAEPWSRPRRRGRGSAVQRGKDGWSCSWPILCSSLWHHILCHISHKISYQ